MRVLYLTLFVVLFDQVTKLIVKGFSIPFLGIDVSGMNYGESIEVLGNFFKITFVENPGMAFGIEVGSAKIILSLFSLFAAIGIFIYLVKVKDRNVFFRVALALILGGAIGNLIDRTFYGMFYGYSPIFYGKVVDFLNVDFFDFTIFGHSYNRWPVFNIADSAVTIGVFILIIFNRHIEKDSMTAKVSEVEVSVDGSIAIDGVSGADTKPYAESETEENNSEEKSSYKGDSHGEPNNRKDSEV